MKWHKKMCDHLDDPFIQELLYEFKSDGYLVYFGTIALICKENKYDNLTGRATFRGRFLKEKFHVSVTKLQQIYDFCVTKGKLSFNFHEKNFDFDFPKILEIKDSHSKGFQVTSKPLPPKKKKEEVEEEADKRIVRKKDFAPLREKFEILWKTLPPEMKRGKEKAWGKFKIQIKTDQDWDDIQKAVPNYLADVQSKREDFPELQFQNGQTWFNLNWKDYVNLEPKLTGPTPMQQARGGRGEFVDKVLKTADRLQSEHPEINSADIGLMVLRGCNGDVAATRKVLYNYNWMDSL